VEGVTATNIVVWSLLAMAAPIYLVGSPSVEVVATQKSSQRIRVVFIMSGVPQKGVRVEVYQYTLSSGEKSKALLSLTSDDEGKVTPPVLSPGHYHLVASAERNLRADLYLDVSRKLGKQISSISMNLIEDQYPTPEQLWDAAEKVLVKDRLEAFRGTIYDPSGARVSGVSIEVARKGTQGKEQIAQVESGKDGRFFAPLADGAYVARFSIPGFQVAFVPFEVTKQGSEELRVTLEIGRATEAVTVSSWLYADVPQRPTTKDQRLIIHATSN
jgi:5-hydroxyisourate hydrolase-like protein (transthyretin family)